MPNKVGLEITGRSGERFPGGQQIDLPSIPKAALDVPLQEAVTGAVGTSRRYAREDHVHPLVASNLATIIAATAVPLVESGTGAVGTAVKYAREDHVHPAASGGGGASCEFHRINGAALALTADNTKLYDVVFDDTTSRTLTLPAANAHAQEIKIRVKTKGPTGVGYHVVAAAGADTIEGAANIHVSDNPSPLDGVTAGLHIRSCILISDGSSIWYFVETVWQVNSG